jgi:mono/diheme cytochrome c family protein
MNRPMMLAALLSIVASVAAHAEQRTTKSGVFSAEQAKNGELSFQSRCAACHGTDLIATNPEAPDLTDEAFKFGWIGKTVANRFTNIRISMPQGSPGSLDDQTYLDIVTYILSFNGMPAGSKKLVPDLAALEEIVIEKP